MNFIVCTQCYFNKKFSIIDWLSALSPEYFNTIFPFFYHATCHINSIKVYETKRFHERNYIEPHAVVSKK